MKFTRLIGTLQVRDGGMVLEPYKLVSEGSVT
jgi:hypothetical protein